MPTQFPTFQSHESASCFNCGGDLTGAHWGKSGYAPGRGQFRQDCEKCRFSTWYDIEPEEQCASG